MSDGMEDILAISSSKAWASVRPSVGRRNRIEAMPTTMTAARYISGSNQRQRTGVSEWARHLAATARPTRTCVTTWRHQRRDLCAALSRSQSARPGPARGGDRLVRAHTHTHTHNERYLSSHSPPPSRLRRHAGGLVVGLVCLSVSLSLSLSLSLSHSLWVCVFSCVLLCAGKACLSAE